MLPPQSYDSQGEFRTRRPEQNLVQYVAESLEHEEDFHFLRFEFLQRLNIVNLEVDLAHLKSSFYHEHQHQQPSQPEDLELLRSKLQQYITAVRDYQYMQDKKSLEKNEQLDRKLRLHKHFYSAADTSDPWESHYSYYQNEMHYQSSSIDPLRLSLMRRLPSRLTFSYNEYKARTKEYDEGASPRKISGFVDKLARFIISIAGGSFLVVPMIVMTMQPSELKSLITVSVSVVVFALILAFGFKSSNIETLVSTATYAAVLVVFVGTSSASASGTGPCKS